MERNINNVVKIAEVQNVEEVNRLLEEGWIIIETRKKTYHEDIDWDEIFYIMGLLPRE